MKTVGQRRMGHILKECKKISKEEGVGGEKRGNSDGREC